MKGFKKEFNLPLFLITLGMLLIMFTVGLVVGTYIASDNIEKLANENIRKQRLIEQQKDRIRELQLFKQQQEIKGGQPFEI
ncbi:hypothetical protein FOC48_05960 [Gemella haemolysans]|uniref:Uncharacterized protein n=2 Tax=Gemella haemolysans TaxID=1379 RepID=A0AA87DYL5_9BACL|nr:hypothetical protein [Gemella haemolysans]EGF88479.1 hypothetical protein HMPREF0428_00997 [Gemella haemolysans M341]QIX88337.1 hypothetical protein FOC48_05960 [Gemella haemolysans]